MRGLTRLRRTALAVELTLIGAAMLYGVTSTALSLTVHIAGWLR